MPPPGRPFPAVSGGCFCGSVRYRLMTSPLFCYACHCADCHKHSGSIFASYTVIEADMLTSIGTTQPKFTNRRQPSSLVRRTASCPECGTALWAHDEEVPVTLHVRSGTLDHPELMEPDLHSFIESKIPWVVLPEGARTCEGAFDFRNEWPKISLKRFDAAVKRRDEQVRKVAAAKAQLAAKVQMATREKEAPPSEDEKEADKTPTAQSPEEKEDDEEFEKRYRETERALQERLEKLTLKLVEEDKAEAKAAETETAEKKV